MGDVYRAQDLETGEQVALKVITRLGRGYEQRFDREAEILRSLRHHGIVRYVAHGITSTGEAFLAMTWLSGQTLAERLRLSPLSAADTQRLMLRVCEALNEAHSRGIIHRDLKPANLFLVNDNVGSAVLLDFGVARDNAHERMTLTGTLLGTLGYIAPEQALGDTAPDARADVFALGCILYECLTSEALYDCPNPIAALSRLLQGQVPRLAGRDRRLAAFDPVLSRMLARDPAMRLGDAAEVLEAMRGLGPLPTKIAAVRGHAAVSSRERQFSTIVLCKLGRSAQRCGAELETFVQRAAGARAELHWLSKRTLLILLRTPGDGLDRARFAAHVASELTTRYRRVRTVLVTMQTQSDEPISVISERATALALVTARARGIDHLTSELLSSRSEYVRTGSARVHADSACRLISQECDARHKELALLEATWRECQSDCVLRTILVTGASGLGKSHLAQAFIARARSTGAIVLAARGQTHHGEREPAILRQLFESRPTNSSQVASHSTSYLAELMRTPLVDADSHSLTALSSDPCTMRVQKRQAFAGFFCELSEQAPLLIVIDDLQWGDLTSVGYLEEALPALVNRSIMICLLARPSVYERFPRLDLGERQDVRLGRLSTRASERIAFATSGGNMKRELTANIVRLADGNPHLLQAASRAEQRGEEQLSSADVAFLQFRIEQLAVNTRRVLRAASVFGERCWKGGIQALVDDEVDTAVELERLIKLHILVRVRPSRFPNQAEYAWATSGIRAAAHEMLDCDDRRHAHTKAGVWMQSMYGRSHLSTSPGS